MVGALNGSPYIKIKITLKRCKLRKNRNHSMQETTMAIQRRKFNLLNLYDERVYTELTKMLNEVKMLHIT